MCGEKGVSYMLVGLKTGAAAMQNIKKISLKVKMKNRATI